MNVFDVVIYGVIQGLTEFLPVSSSAHLALLPHFLHVEDPGVLFDLSMHIGTLLAVFVYFFHEVKRLVMSTFSLLLFKEQKLTDRNLTLNLILSTGSTFIGVVLLHKASEDFGRSIPFITTNLALFGLFLYLSDKLFGNGENVLEERVAFIPAITIGLLQSLSIFPGVSRSGSTITGARFFRLSRKDATNYSFLLSVPIIAGGAILKVPEYFSSNTAVDLKLLLIGISCSFVVGLISIFFLIKIIMKVGTLPFFIYRIILASLIYYHLG